MVNSSHNGTQAPGFVSFNKIKAPLYGEYFILFQRIVTKECQAMTNSGDSTPLFKSVLLYSECGAKLSIFKDKSDFSM